MYTWINPLPVAMEKMEITPRLKGLLSCTHAMVQKHTNSFYSSSTRTVQYLYSFHHYLRYNVYSNMHIRKWFGDKATCTWQLILLIIHTYHTFETLSLPEHTNDGGCLTLNGHSNREQLTEFVHYPVSWRKGLGNPLTQKFPEKVRFRATVPGSPSPKCTNTGSGGRKTSAAQPFRAARQHIQLIHETKHTGTTTNARVLTRCNSTWSIGGHPDSLTMFSLDVAGEG